MIILMSTSIPRELSGNPTGRKEEEAKESRKGEEVRRGRLKRNSAGNGRI